MAYRLKSKNKKNPGFFVHDSAVIDEGVNIGAGTQVWHFSHILKGSRIGDDCRIGQNVVIGPDVKVGNNVKIQNNVSVYKGVTLEDDVFCGPSCVFTNVFNPRSAIPRMKDAMQTGVGKGATIGANATIVCGNDIGKYAFIGAGAVITASVPDYALVYGNPARFHGWICECAQKIEFRDNHAICPSCKAKYLLKDDKVKRVK